MSSALMPQPRHGQRTFFLLMILANSGLFLAYCPSLADSCECLLLVQPTPPPPPRGPTPPAVVLVDSPAVCQPYTLPAQKAALDDDTPVIGVVAGGKARAYLVEAFERGPASHIVNDVVGGVPISVAYCDISGCTRIFTGPKAGQPLDLLVGGIKDSRMVLKVNGHIYRQETAEALDKSDPYFPYQEYPADLTVWAEWRRAHPKTDVYMGALEEATPTEVHRPRLSVLHEPSPGPRPAS